MLLQPTALTFSAISAQPDRSSPTPGQKALNSALAIAQDLRIASSSLEIPFFLGWFGFVTAIKPSI